MRICGRIDTRRQGTAFVSTEVHFRYAAEDDDWNAVGVWRAEWKRARLLRLALETTNGMKWFTHGCR